jgi:hypothetical protein
MTKQTPNHVFPSGFQREMTCAGWMDQGMGGWELWEEWERWGTMWTKWSWWTLWTEWTGPPSRSALWRTGWTPTGPISDFRFQISKAEEATYLLFGTFEPGPTSQGGCTCPFQGEAIGGRNSKTEKAASRSRGTLHDAKRPGTSHGAYADGGFSCEGVYNDVSHLLTSVARARSSLSPRPSVRSPGVTYSARCVVLESKCKWSDDLSWRCLNGSKSKGGRVGKSPRMEWWWHGRASGEIRLRFRTK